MRNQWVARSRSLRRRLKAPPTESPCRESGGCASIRAAAIPLAVALPARRVMSNSPSTMLTVSWIGASCRRCSSTPLGAACPSTPRWLLRQDSGSAGALAGPAQVTDRQAPSGSHRRRRRRTRAHTKAQLRADRQPRPDRDDATRLEIGEEHVSDGRGADTAFMLARVFAA